MRATLALNGLMGQARKIINFCETISGHIQSSQPAFIIHIITSQVGQHIELDRILFWSNTYLGIFEKKSMAAVNITKFN